MKISATAHWPASQTETKDLFSSLSREIDIITRLKLNCFALNVALSVNCFFDMKPVTKYLASLLILLAASPSLAGSLTSGQSEASNCVECSLPASNLDRNAADARDLRNAVISGSEAQAVADVNSKMNWSDGCVKFAAGSSYGKWGNLINSELASNNYDEMMRGSSDIKQLCPGYDQLSREGKQGLWVVILAAMANHESSCRINPPLHGGPNGTLVGLYQLHNGHEKVYSPAGCRNGDGRQGETSIKCTMSMLNDQMGREGQLFSNKAYWEVLQPKSKKKIYLEIRQNIQNYGLCK
ncbi:MAG TPA: hypothetical protein VF412_09090 [Bdellovibrio sp.]|uniref:hypothetical protein n=1 Tax=Bdellovibrio sp. TaxID=28201 RepID=UPI002EEE338A